MRGARHHVGDGLAVVFVALAVGFEECIDPGGAIEPALHRLQPERHAVIGESELDVRQPRCAAVAGRVDPHAIEHGERARDLDLRPWLLREEVGGFHR
jgi:hypothetical protein